MRIAIVNDMPLAIEAIRRVLRDCFEHSIAWIARDGAQALEHCASDPPDLVLMDLIMPTMDGVEATRQIMAHSPCAILIVTASLLGNSAKVFEAMAAGALDVCQTPQLFSGNGSGAATLLYKINSIGQLIGWEKEEDDSPSGALQLLSCRQVPLVAIGASAGGPGALATILSSIPADFPAGIVVVQHVDQEFVNGLAEWLHSKSSLPVRIACERDEIQPGTVLLAGGERHLVLRSRDSLSYTLEPREKNYRPSVDVFFESIARHWRGEALGVLLTGMGRDGAQGLLSMRKAGFHTIAQDRSTSAVYGMPKAAADLGSAAEILALEKIASALVRFGNKQNPTVLP
jgi:chemotaxis response regulator CheB